MNSVDVLSAIYCRLPTFAEFADLTISAAALLLAYFVGKQSEDLHRMEHTRFYLENFDRWHSIYAALTKYLKEFLKVSQMRNGQPWDLDNLGVLVNWSGNRWSETKEEMKGWNFILPKGTRQKIEEIDAIVEKIHIDVIQLRRTGKKPVHPYSEEFNRLKNILEEIDELFRLIIIPPKQYR